MFDYDVIVFHCQPLPGKQLLKYFDHFSFEFLEQRKKGLDKFLKRIASHPILSFDVLFMRFLTSKSPVSNIVLTEFIYVHKQKNTMSHLLIAGGFKKSRFVASQGGFNRRNRRVYVLDASVRRQRPWR